MQILEIFDIYFLIICVVYAIVLLVKDVKNAKENEDDIQKREAQNVAVSLIVISLILFFVQMIFR